MELSSTFCRVQETFQRNRADNAVLENVRIAAGKAASAWGIVALGAERREAHRERARIIAEMGGLRNERSPDDEDRLFSENPDRGRGDP